MKKRLLHMLLAAAMVVSAVGCGSVKTTNTDQAGNSTVEEKKDGGGTAASDGEVVEIRFTEWDGGDTLAVYEEIAENFNKEHPCYGYEYSG